MISIKNILISFLNAILKFEKEQKIKDLIFIRNEKIPDILEIKNTILDISADRLAYYDDIFSSKVTTLYSNRSNILSAIADAMITNDISSKASIPLWVMVIGAVGTAFGLALYGPKLIKTVGGEITELDAMRAYSIAMASALTVIVASQLGLPVSTTHIAIGGVFGVGFLREYLNHKQRDLVLQEETKEINELNKKINELSEKINKLEAEPEESRDFKEIAIAQKELNIAQNRLIQINQDIENIEKANYVQRSFISKIVAAWLITVPAAAVISALIFFIIRGMML